MRRATRQSYLLCVVFLRRFSAKYLPRRYRTLGELGDTH
jgi:hypothetical protein